jgi:hypothetical protein
MGWEEDGTTKILFGVIGLVRCGGACNRQGDHFLRFKLAASMEPDHPTQSSLQSAPVVKLREGVDSALPRSMYLCRLSVFVSA